MKNTAIKIQNNFIYIITLLYIFFISKISFPLNFQQDDISELKVANFQDFVCVLDQGDNHPIFSYSIWLIAKAFPENTEYIISVFNIVISIVAIFALQKLILKLSNQIISLLITSVFISSDTFLVYSVSLKQYSIEVLGCIIFVSILTESFEEGFNLFENYKLVLICFVLSITSLPLLVLFSLILLFILYKRQLKFQSFYKFLVIFSPALLFIPRIISKISRPTFRNYWSDFFIQTSSVAEFFSSSINIFNLMMDNYFGVFYIQKIGILYFLFFLYPLILKDWTSVRVFSLIGIFIIFNIGGFYPLGAGRTDLILFPLFLILISRSFFFLNLNTLLIQISLIFFLVLSSTLVSPYYKIESMTPILKDVSRAINSQENLIIPMVEQKHPFEYYSKKMFGKISEIEDTGCKILKPNISNYLVFDPDYETVNSELLEILSSGQYKDVYLIGIELPGTEGVIREVETLLVKSNYNFVSQNLYDVGMLLIRYSK